MHTIYKSLIECCFMYHNLLPKYITSHTTLSEELNDKVRLYIYTKTRKRIIVDNQTALRTKNISQPLSLKLSLWFQTIIISQTHNTTLNKEHDDKICIYIYLDQEAYNC